MSRSVIDACFFMSFSDCRNPGPVRECRILRQVRYGSRKDVYLVEITPPIQPVLPKEGFPGTNMFKEETQFFIAARHKGYPVPIHPIQRFLMRVFFRFPVDVHILRLLDESKIQNAKFESSDMERYLWAELHLNRKSAERYNVQNSSK
jgi:hypothetical protein